MIDWIETALSEEQQHPFSRKTLHASVLAAAGSGKTHTLTYLLAADLATGISPENIVAFTFTEKAAAELTARVHGLVRQHMPELDLNGMFVGTIHAWCFQYLLKQSEFLNFSPLDELHVDALASRLYDALNIEAVYGKPYPRGVGSFLSDLEIFYNEHLSLDQVPWTIRPSIDTFIRVLHGNRLLTFGAMIRNAIEHLTIHGSVPGLAALYVDEYQDVNPAQVELIKAMLPDGAKVVAVGDDLQSIYHFRGSDVSRILHFPQEFFDTSVWRLGINYRSRPGIVDVGNAIAEDIVLKDPEKKMYHGRSDAPTPIVHWIERSSEEEQAETVADIVMKFADSGVPWNRIAVLLRSVTGSGPIMVDTLKRHQIPINCPVLSRAGSFITEVVIPVFDWLRKEHGEPRNKIEEAETEQATQELWLRVQPWIKATDPENAFWDSLVAWNDLIASKRNEAYDVRGRFYDFLDQCAILIKPDDSDLMLGLGIASQIIRSVEEIHRRRLHGQQRRTPRGVMSEVYFALRRNYQDFGESVPVNGTSDGVVVSTIHQSKGLEWPIVILPSLVKNRFPVRPRPHGTSFPNHVAVRYGTSLDDERRLFYVAATRARERLFLIDYAAEDRKNMSVFLRDLETRGAIYRELAPPDSNDTWIIAIEDLKIDDPPPIRVGLSDLLLYLECPYQYGLRRVADIQPSVGDELGFGLGLHELIQRRLDNDGSWEPHELEEHVSRHVNLPYMSESGEQQSRLAVSKRINRLEQLNAFAVDQVQSEMRVEAIFRHGIVQGVIDSLEIQADGSVHIRDWKSNIHEVFLDRYRRQLQFYAGALRSHGRTVVQANIVDVAATDRLNRIIRYEVDISEEAVGALFAELELAVEGIASESFPVTPSPPVCARCDMYRLCSERSEP